MSEHVAGIVFSWSKGTKCAVVVGDKSTATIKASFVTADQQDLRNQNQWIAKILTDWQVTSWSFESADPVTNEGTRNMLVERAYEIKRMLGNTHHIRENKCTGSLWNAAAVRSHELIRDGGLKIEDDRFGDAIDRIFWQMTPTGGVSPQIDTDMKDVLYAGLLACIEVRDVILYTKTELYK